MIWTKALIWLAGITMAFATVVGRAADSMPLPMTSAEKGQVLKGYEESQLAFRKIINRNEPLHYAYVLKMDDRQSGKKFHDKIDFYRWADCARQDRVELDRYYPGVDKYNDVDPSRFRTIIWEKNKPVHEINHRAHEAEIRPPEAIPSGEAQLLLYNGYYPTTLSRAVDELARSQGHQPADFNERFEFERIADGGLIRIRSHAPGGGLQEEITLDPKVGYALRSVTVYRPNGKLFSRQACSEFAYDETLKQWRSGSLVFDEYDDNGELIRHSEFSSIKIEPMDPTRQSELIKVEFPKGYQVYDFVKDDGLP